MNHTYEARKIAHVLHPVNGGSFVTHSQLPRASLVRIFSRGKEVEKRKQEVGQKERNWLMGERSGIGSYRDQTNAMLIEVFSNGFLRRKK